MLTKRNNAMRRTTRKKNQDNSIKTKKVMMKFAATWIWFPSRRLSAISAQLGREYLVLRIDEGGRYCNGSPILEACASDEIHSAVSHNPNTLDGSFRLIVRKKHLPWAHVRVISTLRYPSSQLPRPNQQRRSCGGRGGETCIFDLPAAVPLAVA